MGPGRPQSLVDRGADLRAVPEPFQGLAPSSTPQNVAGDLSIPRDTRSLGDHAKAAPGPPGAREPSPGAAPSPPARGLGAQRPLNRNTFREKEASEVSSVRTPDFLPDLSHSRP